MRNVSKLPNLLLHAEDEVMILKHQIIKKCKENIELSSDEAIYFLKYANKLAALEAKLKETKEYLTEFLEE